MFDLEVISLDIVDRIFELADEQFLEQRDFAAAIGVTPSIVSEWRRRKSASYVKRLEIISQVLGTTPQYLLSGEKSEEGSAPIDRVEPELREYLDQLRNRDEMRLLFSVTKGATKEQVEAIVKMIESMQGKS